MDNNKRERKRFWNLYTSLINYKNECVSLHYLQCYPTKKSKTIHPKSRTTINIISELQALKFSLHQSAAPRFSNSPRRNRCSKTVFVHLVSPSLAQRAPLRSFLSIQGGRAT